jgi:hypothetical protein
VGGPVAFLSYAHADDDETDGAVSSLHHLLSQELRLQSAGTFLLFRDRNDLQWGEAWRQVINETLDSAALLVAVISPSFFASDECRRELDRFLVRELQLGRRDLILPIYWIDTSILEDEAERQGDELGEYLAGRQYTDGRSWRFRLPAESATIRPVVADLARRMINIVNRPLYSTRSAIDASNTSVVKGGRAAVPREPGKDQWLADLVDLRKATALIDQDTSEQIRRAILRRRFGEF